MQFKLVGGKDIDGDRAAEAEVEFTKAFMFTAAHATLLGRVYGALVAAVDDLAVPMRRIIHEQREALRNSYSFILLAKDDRESVEWLLDRAVSGEAPGRPMPDITDCIRVIARLNEAISTLIDVISDAAPTWRWHLVQAIDRHLMAEPAFRRLDGVAQSQMMAFLEDDDLRFAHVRAIERERGR